MYKESITPDEIQKLDYINFPGKIHVIDSVGAEFNRAIAYLRSQKVIGFDTETRPTFTPSQPRYGVALLQLSGPDKAFLFRVNCMGMHRRLCNLLASDKVLKVGAAIHDDIKGLQRLREYVPAGFVDLQKIVCEWGIRDKSVKKMAAIIMGARVSKTQQLSNWEAESLSESQQMYAATDAWVCREMYLTLMASEKNPLQEEQY
jgi:ribonuclease D